MSSLKHRLSPFGNGVVAQTRRIKKDFSGGTVFYRDGNLFGMVAALRHAPGTGAQSREAFILSIDEIRAEVNRLVRR